MLTHLLTSALKELKVGPGMLGALGMEPWKVSWFGFHQHRDECFKAVSAALMIHKPWLLAVEAVPPGRPQALVWMLPGWVEVFTASVSQLWTI